MGKSKESAGTSMEHDGKSWKIHGKWVENDEEPPSLTGTPPVQMPNVPWLCRISLR